MSLSKNEIEELIESLIKENRIDEVSELLLDEYGSRAKNILANYKINNDHDRQTIIHDAIELFVDKIKSDDKLTYYQSYFNSICVNKAKDFRKKFVNRNFFSVTLDYFTQVFDSITNKTVIGEFRIDEVKKCLKNIGDECQRRIELFYLKEMSHAELVVRFKNTNSERSSRVQLARCMDKLRREIGLK